MAKKKDNTKGLSATELSKQLSTLREELRVLAFKGEGARSKNVKEESALKRQVARVLTEINKYNNK